MVDLFVSGVMITVATLSTQVSNAQYTACPHEWELFGESCYKFVFHPTRPYEEAKADCQLINAALVSVTSTTEHSFISNFLQRSETRRNNWFTGGEEVALETDTFWWEGTGRLVSDDASYWMSQRERKARGSIIIYKYTGASYAWSRTLKSNTLPYICEIPLSEANRVFQLKRDFYFGSTYTQPSEIRKGPKFTIFTSDKIVIGKPDMTFLDCEASGNPAPTYRWVKLTQAGSVDIYDTIEPRYTFTNGRFTISQPEEGSDAGSYQCLAENEIGTIVSSPARLSFGYLREFSNVPRQAVSAISFQGASIECGVPVHKPGVRYHWYKNNPNNFVRPNLHSYLFISQNGKLYFSEVTKVDKANYYCVVQLNRRMDSDKYNPSEYLVPSPSGTSLPIPLIVGTNPALEWGPDIQNDFIAVFPRSPLRGHNLRLECFAYGTGPLEYSWSRQDKPMPNRYILEDHSRVLNIKNVQIEDSGVYTCLVSRRRTATAEKSFALQIGALPYFPFPLRDQHVDQGSHFTWRCWAKAVPLPTYRWFKDGKPVQVIQGQVEVHTNVLVIHQLDGKRDKGMYQCEATNLHGTTYSSGQIRVLAFKPSFNRMQVAPYSIAATSGNITIICEPDAAPFPTYEWTKNGASLDLQPGVQSGRYLLLPSGSLEITDVQNGDGGRYTCAVTNQEGSSSSSGSLIIVGGISIYRRPEHTWVMLNDTAFLYCEASYPKALDLVYVWSFNDHRIDIKDDPHYSQGSGNNIGGLYIRNAQFIHDGEYKCVAQTTLDKVFTKARLTVFGPPAEMAGVYVDRQSIAGHSMKLKWTVTSDNGRPITSFIIEALTKYREDWFTIAQDITIGETRTQGEDKSYFVVDGLKPNVGYSFRVRAINEVGVGTPSVPCDIYHTTGAPPNVAPDKVGGGGGSVGLLTLTWEPLDPIDAHGKQIGYVVYWRRQGNRLKWDKAVVLGNVGKYVTLVGQDNFYLEYEMKIQAYNEFGPGPNSSVEIVFSAEGIPIGMLAGFDLNSVNSTALEVIWEPLPETRQSIKGKVLGYWINYWIEPELNDGMDEEEYVYMNYKPVSGQVGSAIVIGLNPGTYYMFTIQVFNTAGLGPVSEDEYEETESLPPRSYPVEVKVHSYGEDSVWVTFRGVSKITVDEDPLRGYMLRYWPAGNDIRAAIDIDLGMETKGSISGLEKDKLYELRTLGYNGGGYGKHSPSIFFTLGGQVKLDPTITELMAGSSRTTLNWVLLMAPIVALLNR